MSLYQAFRLVCSAGLLFRRGKSRQKRAGETPDPLCLPNRTSAREKPVATEFPLGRWPPRNRYGGRLTSPDGPRDEGCFFFVSGSLGGSDNRRQFDIEIRFAYPFNRATAEVG